MQDKKQILKLGHRDTISASSACLKKLKEAWLSTTRSSFYQHSWIFPRKTPFKCIVPTEKKLSNFWFSKLETREIILKKGEAEENSTGRQKNTVQPWLSHQNNPETEIISGHKGGTKMQMQRQQFNYRFLSTTLINRCTPSENLYLSYTRSSGNTKRFLQSLKTVTLLNL